MHCHGVDGKGYAPLFAPLAGNPNVVQSDTHSVINVTLNGTADLVLAGMPAAYRMPSYGAVLNDEQIAAVLSFVRAGWGNGASAVSVEDVRKIRAVTSRLPQ
jgi:mono/diheme cytochrome c family protein